MVLKVEKSKTVKSIFGILTVHIVLFVTALYNLYFSTAKANTN